MKRIGILFLLLSLVALGLPISQIAAAPAIGLTLDGVQLVTDVPPALIGGRTLVPLRVVSESLGAKVVWTSATAPIAISKGTDQISLQLGVRTAHLNGQTLQLDVPAQMVGGRTMVPIRFISESFGAEVKWESSPPSVQIISQLGQLGKANLVRKDDQIVSMSFVSSRPISLGQPQTSDDGSRFTIAVKNVAALAETQSGLGSNGLLSYTVTPNANDVAISLSLGSDAAYRSPKAAIQADKHTLVLSWPLVLRQAGFAQSGGMESLAFQLPSNVRPELVDTTVEVSSAGTLTGRANHETGVNLRPGPSTQLERIALVAYQQPVTIIAETTGWYQVRLADGREGWMSDEYTAVDTVIEEQSGVNVRPAPNRDPVITILRAGQKITVLERQSGWYRISYGAGKIGWVADWLVPLSSKLAAPDTLPGIEIFFPGMQRECELSGDLAISRHIKSLVWKQTELGSTAIVQLKHPVGYRTAQTTNGWQVVFGTLVNGLQLSSSTSGSKLQLTLDGRSEPKATYLAGSQQLVVSVANASLADGVPLTLAGDGLLVSSAQAAQVGGDVRVTVSLLRKTAYSLRRSSDSVWELGFSSSSLVDKLIALDPGHGASDPGAMGTLGWNEKDYTHDIVNRLRTQLQAVGAKVVTTREVQSGPIVHHDRAALINQSGASLYLSVHINSYTNRSITGLETYYYPRNENERFARLVQSELVSSLGWADRGVRSNTLYILPRETLVTGVLAEIGYISNAHDQSELYKPEVRQQIAEALFKAIERYFAD